MVNYLSNCAPDYREPHEPCGRGPGASKAFAAWATRALEVCLASRRPALYPVAKITGKFTPVRKRSVNTSDPVILGITMSSKRRLMFLARLLWNASTCLKTICDSENVVAKLYERLESAS